MINFSRRQLAHYAVDEMLAGTAATVLSQRLAAGLIISGRQKQAELLLSDIDQELEDRGLAAKARVTTAHPLSAGLRNALLSEIKKMVGTDQVELETNLDKSIIGGVKIETANHSWDKTAKRLLNQLGRAA